MTDQVEELELYKHDMLTSLHAIRLGVVSIEKVMEIT